ncbi:MAG: HAMP domain-containing histidine kinase [Saccharofermentans sp.]|nr:HAMP domain-containing histidine kinase [Saccharofermentans sp.]
MGKTKLSGYKGDSVSNPSKNLIIFSIAAAALFLLMLLLDAGNTSIHKKPFYIETDNSYYLGSELATSDLITLDIRDKWTFIPNVTPGNVESGLLNGDAWRDSMPYADNVTLTNSFKGWNDYDKAALWHNRTDNFAYQTYMIDDSPKVSSCYYIKLECDREVENAIITFNKLNGIARVYCNGELAGTIGSRSNQIFNDNIYSDYAILTPKNGVMELAIVVSCNSKVLNPGILSGPVINNMHTLDLRVAQSASMFSVVSILMFTTFFIGSYIILSNNLISKAYSIFFASFFAIALYYLFDERLIAVDSHIAADARFTLIIVATLASQAINSYIFWNSKVNRKHPFLKYDLIFIAGLGLSLLLAYYMTHILGYSSIPVFVALAFGLVVLYLTIIKDLIFYRSELAGPSIAILYYCYFIFLLMLSILMSNLSNSFLPTYAILLSLIIFICLIAFTVTMNRSHRRMSRDATVLKRQVREKTLFISEINRDLVASNKQLKEGEQARKNVLSNVSHDLRTPITAIRGYAELMLTSKSMTREQTDSYLNNIIRRSEQMERIVSDIVELTRMEASDADFNYTDVSMSEMLDELVTMYGLDLNGTSKHITLDLPNSDLLIVRADPKKFSRVFENLISNAIYYTNSEAEINVKAWRTGEGLPIAEQKIHITVKDNGIGIPPDEITKIFDRFYRAKNSGVNTKGTGLGLAIVKLICDRHNATIKVDSAIGSGTTFEIIIGATY